jgi:CRP/FNR family transcriptional regulator, cyclic AMP receptor protein
MSDDDVVGFSFLAEASIPVWYLKPGETICKEGETAKELYVIRSGQVEIQLGNRLLATLEANEIFGEMALIESAPRSPKPTSPWSPFRRRISSLS